MMIELNKIQWTRGRCLCPYRYRACQAKIETSILAFTFFIL